MTDCWWHDGPCDCWPRSRYPQWWREEKLRRWKAEEERKAGTLFGRLRTLWRKYVR